MDDGMPLTVTVSDYQLVRVLVVYLNFCTFGFESGVAWWAWLRGGVLVLTACRVDLEVLLSGASAVNHPGSDGGRY